MKKELLTEAAIRATSSDFKVAIDDETLRDGTQDPDARQPNPEEAIELFDLMRRVGTQSADIGFPASGECNYKRVLAVAQHKASLSEAPEISCASRSLVSDVAPIVEISQKAGVPIRADIFIGTDPRRIKAEKWTLPQMLEWVDTSVSFAIEHNIPVMMVTETTIDGIREIPDFVKQIYLAGLHKGATRVCICDTSGSAAYYEVEDAVRWMRTFLNENGFDSVEIDFHGHRDLAVAEQNTIAAFRAGAVRGHVTMLGTGERIGNTDRTALQLLLRRTGMDQGAYDLTVLPEYAQATSRILGVPISSLYPGLGEKSRAQVAGPHASAVLKGLENLPEDDAGGIYLPVNYRKILGIQPSHIATVGPQSGEANVRLWAKLNEVEITDESVRVILRYAKDTNTVLTDDDIKKLLKVKQLTISND